MTGPDVVNLKQKMRESLARLRPEAAGIVDAFGLLDEEINSALGCYDGNVYERLLDIIRKNPLNQVTVPKGYNEYMRPFKAKL